MFNNLHIFKYPPLCDWLVSYKDLYHNNLKFLEKPSCQRICYYFYSVYLWYCSNVILRS